MQKETAIPDNDRNTRCTRSLFAVITYHRKENQLTQATTTLNILLIFISHACEGGLGK